MTFSSYSSVWASAAPLLKTCIAQEREHRAPVAQPTFDICFLPEASCSRVFHELRSNVPCSLLALHTEWEVLSRSLLTKCVSEWMVNEWELCPCDYTNTSMGGLGLTASLVGEMKQREPSCPYTKFLRTLLQGFWEAKLTVSGECLNSQKMRMLLCHAISASNTQHYKLS